MRLRVSKQSVTRIVGAKEEGRGIGNDGVPGLILRHEGDPRQRTLGGALRWGHAHFSLSELSLSEPLTIPFTREYHLFRASSGQLPSRSMVRIGTPLDAVYVTTNGGLMQMEAYQILDPPIDFSHCGRIQLNLPVKFFPRPLPCN